MVSFRFSALASIVCAAILVNVSSGQTFDLNAACTDCYGKIPAGCQAKIALAKTSPSEQNSLAAYKDCICTNAFLNNMQCLGCAAGTAQTTNTAQVQGCQKMNLPATSQTSSDSKATTSPSPSSGAKPNASSSASPSGTASTTATGAGARNYAPVALFAGALLAAINLA